MKAVIRDGILLMEEYKDMPNVKGRGEKNNS
jgi:hypothetical protein